MKQRNTNANLKIERISCQNTDLLISIINRMIEESIGQLKVIDKMKGL